MKNNTTLNTILIFLFCLATTALTIMAAVYLSKLTGHQLHSFSIWFILPIGACFTGLAATSGTYLGGLFLGQKPTVSISIVTVLCALTTKFAIHYIEYRDYKVDNNFISEYVPFSNYLDIVITESSSTVRFGHNPKGVDLGKSSFPYLKFSIHCLGFIFGGLMSLIFLVDKEYCEKCSSYMRNSGVKTFEFKTSEESETFINFLHGLDTKSEAFKAQIELKTDLPAIEVGTVAILHSLSICPKCLKQNIAETVSVFNGKNWKAQASLKYNYSLPEQTDVSATFKGNTTEKKAA